jgi:signal transduction histidine kinase
MRQLGGNLELSSAQGGTTVTATIPIPEEESDL